MILQTTKNQYESSKFAFYVNFMLSKMVAILSSDWFIRNCTPYIVIMNGSTFLVSNWTVVSSFMQVASRLLTWTRHDRYHHSQARRYTTVNSICTSWLCVCKPWCTAVWKHCESNGYLNNDCSLILSLSYQILN